MARPVVRTGRQRAALAAAPGLVADVLVDPPAVTELLGDLLDQERSEPGPPTRWVVPRVRVGPANVRAILLARFERTDDVVVITAVTTPDSDIEAELSLRLDPTGLGPAACRLETAWRIELVVPLPRTAMRLAAPALDRAVAATVQRIMRRTEAAVLAATQ